MLGPILCGAVGFGTVGHIENAITFSPIQLVMDNEIARYVRRVVQGFEVSDESVNFDLIRRVGIGGNYLTEMETAEGFRDFLNLSPFFGVEPWGSSDEAREARRWEKMAADKVRELLASDVPSPLSPEQTRAVDGIVAEAEARLREQGRM